jgi:hypothetical protein
MEWISRIYRRYLPRHIMQKLAEYIAAMLGRTSSQSVIDRVASTSAWQEPGFAVSIEVADYRFENGVVIRRTVEQDDQPSEQACAECWITYEVIDHGSVATGISPARVVFQNACRESFWLAYHTA